MVNVRFDRNDYVLSGVGWLSALFFFMSKKTAAKQQRRGFLRLCRQKEKISLFSWGLFRHRAKERGHFSFFHSYLQNSYNGQILAQNGTFWVIIYLKQAVLKKDINTHLIYFYSVYNLTVTSICHFT